MSNSSKCFESKWVAYRFNCILLTLLMSPPFSARNKSKSNTILAETHAFSEDDAKLLQYSCTACEKRLQKRRRQANVKIKG